MLASLQLSVQTQNRIRIRALQARALPAKAEISSDDVLPISVDGQYGKLFADRDLAASYQIDWLAMEEETAKTTKGVATPNDRSRLAPRPRGALAYGRRWNLLEGGARWSQ